MFKKFSVMWLLITIGTALRFTDLSFPDFTTDEAQAALAATAAWTPGGMMTFHIAQMLFGHSILVVRLTSALFGIAFLPLLYLLAREYGDRKMALTVTAVAALFPSHILFSRLAYLSTQLLFAWTLTLYCFLKAREKNNQKWLALLFFASVYATFIKTQGLVLPALLALGILVQERRTLREFSIINSQLSIAWALLLSLIPVTLYILTHPGIIATTLLYGGNLYGISHVLTRVGDLLHTWWHVLSVFLLVTVLCLRFLPVFSWPLWITLGLVSVHGLLLGPGNAYYTTELVLFALPIGLGLSRLPSLTRTLTLCALLITTLMLLGPRTFHNPWTLEPFREEGYWNAHAESINAILKGENAVTVLGYAGHELRWYLAPRILVGRNMIPPYPTKYLLVRQDQEAARELGTVVYEDAQIAVVHQNGS